MSDSAVEAYWQAFLRSLPAETPYRANAYLAEGFGDSPKLADELGALFSRVLPKIGKEFSEDMPLVCERFRVIYK